MCVHHVSAGTCGGREKMITGSPETASHKSSAETSLSLTKPNIVDNGFKHTPSLSSQGKLLLSHMSVLWWLNEFVCIFLKCLTIQDLSQEPTGFPLNWFLFSMPVQQLKKTMVPFSMTRVSQKGYRARCRGNPAAFLFPSLHHILEAGFW